MTAAGPPPGGTQLRVIGDVEAPGEPLFDLERLAHPAVGVIPLAAVGLLRHGTSGGRAAVLLRVDLPDGRQVVAQTTWRAFKAAAWALAASPIAAEEG